MIDVLKIGIGQEQFDKFTILQSISQSIGTIHFPTLIPLKEMAAY